MPKLSLKRRHKRQHDLSQCWSEFPGELLTRKTAARMVSNDDIQVNHGDVTSSSTSSFVTSSTSPGLKRSERMISEASVQLISSECLSPTRSNSQLPTDSCSGKLSPHCTSPSQQQPWGHFVDMLVPSSPCQDPAFFSKEGFVPGCPSPLTRVSPLRYHPYRRQSQKHTKKLQRIPIASSRTKMKGFVLRLPDARKRSDNCEGLVLEAEHALMSLHV